MSTRLEDLFYTTIESMLRESIQNSATATTTTPSPAAAPTSANRARGRNANNVPVRNNETQSNANPQNMDIENAEILATIYTMRDIMIEYNNNYRRYTEVIRECLNVISTLQEQQMARIQQNSQGSTPTTARIPATRSAVTPTTTTTSTMAERPIPVSRTARRQPIRTTSATPTTPVLATIPLRYSLDRVIFSNVFADDTYGSSTTTTPRETEINEAIRTIPFEETNSAIQETRCPITLENFQEGEQIGQIIHCGHVFRETALRGWLRRNSACPVCRYDIRRNRSQETQNEEVQESTTTGLSRWTNPRRRPRISDEDIDNIVMSVSSGFSDLLNPNTEVEYDDSMNMIFTFPFVYYDISGAGSSRLLRNIV
jgi:hypothetical protein